MRVRHAHEGLCDMFAVFIHLSSVSVLSNGQGCCGSYFTNSLRRYGQWVETEISAGVGRIGQNW